MTIFRKFFKKPDFQWSEDPETGEQFHPETGEARPTPYVNSMGRSFVSAQPMAIATLTAPPETIEQMVNRILGHSLQANYLLGEETLEEADDFDIADDIPDPVTKYEQLTGQDVQAAVDRGVVKAPTTDELVKAKETLKRVKDYKASLKAPKEPKPDQATPPPPVTSGDASAPASAGQ